MKIKNAKFNQVLKASVLSTLLISTADFSLAQPADRKSLPDLLELPAQQAARALQSIQLGIALAGERLISVGEQGIVLLSDDNGRSWRQSTGVPVSVTLTDVEFTSSMDGWAAGHSGVILHTADGGETWTLQMDGYRAADVIHQEARRRLDAGMPYAEDAVRNAEYLVKEGADKPFLDLFFADQSRGWAVGAYGIALHTLDGGQSWQSSVDLIPNTGGRHLYSVQVEGSRRIIAGEQGSLFRHGAEASTYSRVETPYEGTFFGFVPLYNDELLVFGLRGNVWRSDNESWEAIDLGSESTLTAGLKLKDARILLADEGGHLLLGNDRGLDFKKLDINPVPSITDMTLARDGALILATARGPVRLEDSIFALEDK